MKGQFELYRSGLFRNEWRWRYRASNGRIIFASSEGYRNKTDAERAVELAQRSAGERVVEA